MRNALTVGITAAAVVVALDQVTKAWAIRGLDESVEIIGTFLELELTTNTGSAFGLFRGAGVFLGLAAVVAVVVVLIALGSVRLRSEAIALGAVMGGATGNLIDRIARGDGFLDGAVIDFVKLWWIPNFNVADASLFLGVVTLLLLSWRHSEDRDRHTHPA